MPAPPTPPTPRPTAPLRLVFEGRCLPGHDPRAVREAVALALRLDDARAARLFSGRRVVLRSAVDEPTALRYVARFGQLGAVLRAEPVAAAASKRRSSPEARSGIALSWRLPRQAVVAAVGGLAIVVLTGLVGQPLLQAWQDWRALQSRQAVTAAAGAPAAVPAQAAPATPASAPVRATPLAAAASAVSDTALPADMGPAARLDYRQHYLPAPGHKAFALGTDAHEWQSGAVSEDEARETALARCMRQQSSAGASCRIVDADGELTE